MAKKHKLISRGALFVFIVPFFLTVFTPLLDRVETAHAVSPDELCIPRHNNGTKVPTDWFTARFKNRATLSVTYSPNGNCRAPLESANAAFIFGSKRFNDLIGGDYFDRNTGDGQFEYVRTNSSSDQSDESRIDEFSGDLDGSPVDDPFGGQDRIVTNLRDYLSEVEFVMGIEEDELGADCEGLTNANWMLFGGDSMKWSCSHEVPSSARGFKVGDDIGDLNKFNITYRVVREGDGSTLIQHVSKGQQGDRTFMWCERDNKFMNNGCETEGALYFDVDLATIEGLNSGAQTFTMRKNGSDQSFQTVVAGATNPDGNAAAGVDESTGQTGAGGSAEPSCESEGGEWSWILCPALRMASSAMEKLDQAVQDLLTLPDNYYNDPDLEASWRSIRNIAYIILIPVMLVMVISTALGFEFISAYTVKRALPRLLLAIIFMTLSFEITKFLIILTNNISQGIQGLIISSFHNRADVTLASLFNPGGGAGATFTVGIVGGTLVAAGLLPVILSYLFVGAIILFIALLALSLRQMLLIMFMVLAPLAIIAWIFPGNDKLWKLWWGSFSKLLLLFPLIMILIGSGKAFAALVHSTDSSVFATVLKLTAYIGPYLFIPAMFKFAGGIFATVSGMANDRSKGLFDRQRKYRARKYGEAGQKATAGNYFNPNGRLAGLNRGIQTAALAPKAGLDPRHMRSRLNSHRGVLAGTEVGELLEKNQDIGAVKNDDHLAEAVQHANGRAEIESMLRSTGRYSNSSPSEMGELVSLVERAQRAGSPTAVRSAMAIARANSGTGYDTVADMHESILQAAGGNRSLEGQLLAAARSGSERARRPDLAVPGHVEQALAMDQLRSTMGGDPAAHAAARGQVNAQMRARALEAGGAHALLSGRRQATTQIVQQVGADFDAAMAAGDVTTATELASQITSLRGAMGSASPEVRQEVVSLLDHVGVDLSAIDARTGQSYSTDEQLGVIINTGLQGRTATPIADAQNITQEIRTRAGLYDAGGGQRTPEQIRAMQMQPPE